MNKKISNIAEKMFAVSMIISLLGSTIVLLLVVVATIFSLSNIVLFATNTIMPWCIRFAAFALLNGLLKLYITKEHQLKMD